MKITLKQVEMIRLLMSTYQDGTGQLRISNGTTLPSWRDFERSVATAFGGYAFENKGFLDVIIDGKEVGAKGKIGISCKMRNTLNDFLSKGSISMELSNALKKFWGLLQSKKIHTMGHLRLVPQNGGKVIIDLYESWKYEAVHKLSVNLAESFYLTCLYDEKKGDYQLFALPFLLPKPSSLKWAIREPKDGDENKGTLVGFKKGKVVIEWYGTSGGQLKYFPTIEDVIWKSKKFKLEPIPTVDKDYGLIEKAKSYFPDKWKF